MFLFLYTAPSGPPNSFGLLAQDSNSVTLSWTKVDCDKQNGEILGYVITQSFQDFYNSQYKIEGNDTLTAVVPLETGEAEIIPEDATHTFCIAAENEAGIGVFSAELTIFRL